MSKLSYMMKRAMKMDYRAMLKTANMLHGKCGKGRIWLLLDMVKCAAKYNAGYIDYKIAEMYRLNDAQRATQITRGISNGIVRRMNPKEYWHFFDDKTQFNELFKEWIPRKWLLINDSTTAEQIADMMTLPNLIGKPLEGSSGVGIYKYVPADWAEGPEAFLARLKADGIGILENILHKFLQPCAGDDDDLCCFRGLYLPDIQRIIVEAGNLLRHQPGHSDGCALAEAGCKFIDRQSCGCDLGRRRRCGTSAQKGAQGDK